ncbi:hypothetical protein AB0H36_08765 [Kribbella sp. NPDC050820]|uniref:hypothetical protein n=1 Tax=Kribbella sp. NPDC050820 TaxID=3155408 RepID=UPI00340037A3
MAWTLIETLTPPRRSMPLTGSWVIGCVPRQYGGLPATAAWLQSFGSVVKVGVEGTGVWQRIGLLPERTRGAGDRGRPARPQAPLISRKSDPKYSEEALRNLRIAHRGAISHRADCVRRSKTLVVTASEELRDQVRHLPTRELVTTCAALRCDQIRPGSTSRTTHTRLDIHRSIRRLPSRRFRCFSERIYCRNPQLGEPPPVEPLVSPRAYSLSACSHGRACPGCP